MPTPNLYAHGGRDPFPDVPAELKNNKVEVLYLTDRVPAKDTSVHKRLWRLWNLATGYRTGQMSFQAANASVLPSPAPW